LLEAGEGARGPSNFLVADSVRSNGEPVKVTGAMAYNFALDKKE